MMSFVHLSGTRIGATDRVAGSTARALEVAPGEIVFVPADEAFPAGARPVAIFSLADGAEQARLETAADDEIFVEGRSIRDGAIADGDKLQIGASGPLVRYRALSGAGYKTIGQALDDCVTCARVGGHSRSHSARLFVRGAAYELATQVAPLTRATIFLAMVTMVVALGLLWRRNLELERRVDLQLTRIVQLEALLVSAESSRIALADLDRGREALEDRLEATLDRVTSLEERAGARGNVIATASQAVIFLQGSYGFREAGGGRRLRIRSDAAGNPLRGSDGSVALSFDDADTPLEIRYTGTGFVATDDGLILTNRHVAVPWDFDENAQALLQVGFEPLMVKMVGYLPGHGAPLEVATVRAHPDADVALLRCDATASEVVALELTERAPHIGEEVVVLGYPTGMKALLARADPKLVQEIFANGDVDFWDLAERLAAAGAITPLATVGAVGQVSAGGAVVYDAETTHGGSGGPVVALDGSVLAINAAILPEFGGSNLGVAASAALELLSGERPPRR